ncbi:MAG: hypothetical protein Q8Q67_01785 [bacterium]|nr:hypothetical protein [bacterium]
MKGRKRISELDEMFKRYEEIIAKPADENECQVILLELVTTATTITDVGLASKFESRWMDFKDKVQLLADERIFRDAQNEIDMHLIGILDPESAT